MAAFRTSLMKPGVITGFLCMATLAIAFTAHWWHSEYCAENFALACTATLSITRGWWVFLVYSAAVIYAIFWLGYLYTRGLGNRRKA